MATPQLTVEFDKDGYRIVWLDDVCKPGFLGCPPRRTVLRTVRLTGVCELAMEPDADKCADVVLDLCVGAGLPPDKFFDRLAAITEEVLQLAILMRKELP